LERKLRISWYDVVSSPHYPSARGNLSDPDIETVIRTSGRMEISLWRADTLTVSSEIAALCVYLGSDESAFTTGQALVIDGAWGL